MNATARKQKERALKRKAGFVEKTVWILPSKWGQIQRYIDRVQGK